MTAQCYQQLQRVHTDSAICRRQDATFIRFGDQRRILLDARSECVPVSSNLHVFSQVRRAIFPNQLAPGYIYFDYVAIPRQRQRAPL